MDEKVKIENTDIWFKVVDFLQQNWGVIEVTPPGFTLYFFSDGSGVFDQIEYQSVAEAERALVRNGFSRYRDDLKAQKFVAEPLPPFKRKKHPNGPIYSSGRFWK